MSEVKVTHGSPFTTVRSWGRDERGDVVVISEVRMRTQDVVVSLVVDWPGDPKVRTFPGVFANGDGVEITVKRIPKTDEKVVSE